ncbi:ABC transporter substrate-binding protein [Paenibacillus sp. PCH8]|uniref:ABC transporter substrate-binding protein n=1 Tax=Paenibacillus sp. PCH8 TaxID=2066524 RepID=UPI0015E2FB48|nr:ABC transporter substrate-binding protein [Paenibacillus sp. PCH8]
MIGTYGRLAFCLFLVLAISILTTSCASKLQQGYSLESEQHVETESSAVTSPTPVDSSAPSVKEGVDDKKNGEGKTELPVYTQQQLKAYPSDIRDILSRGKLRVALYHEDRYPFFYVDDQGVLRGSDVDLANDIAFKLGVHAEFIRTADSFDEVIHQVSTSKVDIGVSKLSMTLERAKRVLFSDAYLNLKQALLINRLQLAAMDDQGDVTDPLALIQGRGERIGIVAGTSYVGFAHDLFPDQNQMGYLNSAELFDGVRKGDVLAVVYDAFEISRYLKKFPAYALQLQFVQLDDHDDDIAIAVDPQRYHLHQWINTYLHMEKKEIEKHFENNEL